MPTLCARALLPVLPLAASRSERIANCWASPRRQYLYAGGGEFAEIYFEEGYATQIVAEDGRVEKVLSNADRGAIEFSTTHGGTPCATIIKQMFDRIPGS